MGIAGVAETGCACVPPPAVSPPPSPGYAGTSGATRTTPPTSSTTSTQRKGRASSTAGKTCWGTCSRSGHPTGNGSVATPGKGLWVGRPSPGASPCSPSDSSGTGWHPDPLRQELRHQNGCQGGGLDHREDQGVLPTRWVLGGFSAFFPKTPYPSPLPKANPRLFPNAHVCSNPSTPRAPLQILGGAFPLLEGPKR